MTRARMPNCSLRRHVATTALSPSSCVATSGAAPCWPSSSSEASTMPRMSCRTPSPSCIARLGDSMSRGHSVRGSLRSFVVWQRTGERANCDALDSWNAGGAEATQSLHQMSKRRMPHASTPITLDGRWRSSRRCNALVSSSSWCVGLGPRRLRPCMESRSPRCDSTYFARGPRFENCSAAMRRRMEASSAQS